VAVILRYLTEIGSFGANHVTVIEAKVRDSYIARLTGKPDQPRFTIIEVAVDRQEPMVLQR